MIVILRANTMSLCVCVGIYMNYSDGVDKNALCDDTELNLFCQHVRLNANKFEMYFTIKTKSNE